MAHLTILEFPDPRLRTRAAPVTLVDAEVRTLIDDLLETMYAAKGIGLAATQVDVHRRVLVADVSEGRDAPLALVNPEIVARDLAGMSEESCLSVPGVTDVVPRDLKLTVRALGRDGQPLELEVEGVLAACVQHEMDHLEGRLFVDRLSWIKRASLRWKHRRGGPRPTAGPDAQP
jgi:peptide deformylase